MDDVNLYARDGEYFSPSEPKEQRKARDREEKEVLDSLPLIKRVTDSLKSSIEFYKSIDSVPEDLLTSPEEFMHVVAANKLTKSNLEAELLKLTSLVEEYAADDDR